MIEPKILSISEKKLIGIRTKISLSNNKTSELWQQFMPRRHEVKNLINTKQYYSMSIYENGLDVSRFTPETVFEKWAAVEVSDFGHLPEGMEQHLLTGGQYAVFIHKGPVNTFEDTANYIYGKWLPHSGFKLDHREHFEILGEKYLGPHHPDSEEEVWVPIAQ